MILAIISELHHRLSGELDKIDLRDYYKMSYDKARRMLSAGLCISEFGTRRRFSLATEDMAVKAFMDADRDLRKELGKEYKGSFPELQMYGLH